MNTLKSLALASALIAAGTWAISATAQAPVDQSKMPTTQTNSATAGTDMSDGEVRKIDKDNKKITLKHGAIRSLDMPGMTMVFQVKDVALLDKTQAGDKVKFAVVQVGNAYVVTDIKVTE